MDYHLVMDLIPTVARIFFLKQLGDVSLSAAQCVSLATFGLLVEGWEQKVFFPATVSSDCCSELKEKFRACCLRRCSPSALLQALLLGIGLQHKTVEQLEKEIELPSSQLMGLFNRLIRKFVQASWSSSHTTEN